MSPLEVWVPPDARPKWKCEICDEKFYKGEERKYQRHVVACAKKHEDELAELAEISRTRREDDPFQKSYDPEAEEWLRRRFGS